MRYHLALLTMQREQVATAVREILQVDLKFTGMDLPDDLALIGDGLALDSLDLLMLVTGIEKRFGHKIAPQKLGKDTMSSVGVFITFVHAELVAAGK
jgi:acyl carrier protein